MPLVPPNSTYSRFFPFSDLGIGAFFPNFEEDGMFLCAKQGNKTREIQSDLSTSFKNTHWYINFFLSFIAIFFNGLLLRLIRTKSGDLSRMRPLLIFTATVDLFLAIACWLSGPLLHPSQGHFTIVWNGLLETDGENTTQFLIGVAWWLIIAWWAILPIQCLYRMDVVITSSLKPPQGLKAFAYTVAFTIALIFGAVFSFGISMNPMPDYQETAVDVLQYNGLESNSDLIVGDYSTDLRLKIYANYYTMLLIFGYFVIISTDFFCRQEVNRRWRDLSSTSRMMHRDMARTFLGLGIFPIFTSIIPAIMINYYIGKCIVYPKNTFIMSTLFTLNPLLNAVSAILNITPFRRAVFFRLFIFASHVPRFTQYRQWDRWRLGPLVPTFDTISSIDMEDEEEPQNIEMIDVSERPPPLEDDDAIQNDILSKIEAARHRKAPIVNNFSALENPFL